ncbi:MAG: CCA tRNA nucleotidyltransferase [Parvularculaceae bacterium]
MSEGLTPLPEKAQARFQWMRSGPVEKIIRALTVTNDSAIRFVGGCVRDSLLGLAPKDIDLATLLTPDAVISALRVAGLSAAPTGIEHGTVTAIADHVPVEVTTLRADVSTDGRRASVAFTTDWTIDARRRDFTINALYLTPDLKLFDPVGGLADLAARRVAFIGAAEDRLREDFLRILRFFRFSARFADRFNADGLAACTALRAGIAKLSAERVGDEMMNILALPVAARAVEAMAACGVLAEVWPAPADLASLARLKAIDPDAAPSLALAALWGEAGDGVDARLRLANAQGARRRRAVERAPALTATLSDPAVRALVFRFGDAGFADALLLAEARGDVQSTDGKRLRQTARGFTPPALPFSGRDVLAAGLQEGPLVAETLARAQARWIEEDFPDQRRARAILVEEIARITSTG